MGPAHLIKVGLASLALLAVPAGIDTRALIVDGTGAAMGTVGNPVVTSSSGAGGGLTNNNAAPGANNMGVLPAIANAVSPSYTEGFQVLLSTNLSGQMRTVTQGYQASGVALAQNPVIMGGSFGGNAKIVTLDTNGNVQTAAVAGTAAIGNVGGLTKTVTSVLTRPSTAGPPAYTANDEMTDTGGAIGTITSAATASGGKGIITQCLMSCSSNATTKPDLTVFIYDTTSTPAADNAVFAPSDGVQDTAVGYFRITSAEVGDATSNTGNFTMDSGQIHLPFTTVGSANLFYRVKVNNAYTAGTVSDTYTFRFKIQQDAN